MIDSRYSFIIITPVFEDAEACLLLFQEIRNLFGERAHIVAVDDGSVHKPLLGDDLEATQASFTIISLRRNIGHQRAIAVGLSYVAEFMHIHQSVAVMDSDGEDIPANLPTLFDALGSNCDVVVATRKDRIETTRFKMFYLLYRIMFRTFTGRKISFGNFMTMNSFGAKRLASMQEAWLHLAAAVLASRLRACSRSISRGPRYTGASKMNFVSLALHGFRALMVFAEDVLIRVGAACSFIALLALFSAACATFLKVIGFSSPGWFSVAVGLLFLIFLQTSAIALLTLMLTGVVRSGNVTIPSDYKKFTKEIYRSLR